MSVYSTLTSNPNSGWKDLRETMPAGFRPLIKLQIIFQEVYGTDELQYEINPDGSMKLNLRGTWTSSKNFSGVVSWNTTN